VQFVSNSHGVGNGTVTVKVLANTDSGSRTAHITSPQATPDVQGNTAKVTLTQLGAH
jgi:hypothetical protein